MPRRVRAVVLSCAVLPVAALTFAVALLLSSCGEGAYMATSPAIGIGFAKGRPAVQQLGDTVVSYLNGKTDHATVQALVGPSAQDGLAQMLSSLKKPTGSRVMGMVGHGNTNEVDVDLRFVGGANGPADFAVTVQADPDKETVTITWIQPANSRPDVPL